MSNCRRLPFYSFAIVRESWSRFLARQRHANQEPHVHARVEHRSARDANRARKRSRVVGVRERHAPSRESIQIGRDDFGIAVGVDRVVGLIVRENKQDVRLLLGHARRAQRERRQSQIGHKHSTFHHSAHAGHSGFP